MHNDHYSRGAVDDFSLVITIIFLLLLMLGLTSFFYIVPLVTIHFIDAMFLGEIIIWPFEIIFAIIIIVLSLFVMSTVPKNPITWYIYLSTPVITAFNRNIVGKEQIRYIKEIETWIKENTNGQWRRSRNWGIEKIEYQFLLPSDAMAFKIRWA